MDNRPIGVFDSGVGGLTVVREMIEQLPNENIIYFGDTFFMRSGFLGEVFKGDDTEVLQIKSVIPIGVNNDQNELKNFPRVIAGGSGPAATLVWLTYFNQLLEAAGK